MTNIQNAAKFPIGLPGGQDIEPGEVALVSNWDEIKDHHMVKVHLEIGNLVEAGADKEKAQAKVDNAEQKAADEAAAKAAAEKAAADEQQRLADEAAKTSKK